MRNRRLMRLLMVAGALMALLVVTTVASAASSSYSGNIATPGAYNVYTRNIHAGDSITAEVHCDVPGGNPNSLDTQLRVYFPGNDPSNEDGSDIFSDDSDGIPCGPANHVFEGSLITFVAPVTGPYSFRVQGYGTTVGPYTLTINGGGEGNNNPFTDNRINPQQAATTVLYCDGTTVHGLSVDGQVLFSVENGKSASGAGWSIAPTADGRMLFTGAFPDGKAYYFVYDGCPHGHFDALSGTPPTVFDSGDY